MNVTQTIANVLSMQPVHKNIFLPVRKGKNCGSNPCCQLVNPAFSAATQAIRYKRNPSSKQI